MPGIDKYSTTASENINANTGINWDEGMAPAAVNNSARQNMADTRALINDVAWFQYGVGTKSVAPTYVSGTSFTLAGGDVTAAWHAGRRVKAVGSGTGTIYGSVSSSAYSTGVNTINVTWDSGALSNEALTVYLSAIPVTGSPVPEAAIAPKEGTFTPTDASVGGLTLTNPVGYYRLLPGCVVIWGSYTQQITADPNPAQIGSLPFTSANLTTDKGFMGIVQFAGGGGIPGGSAPNWLCVQQNQANMVFRYAGGSLITNANISGEIVSFHAIYPI